MGLVSVSTNEAALRGNGIQYRLCAVRTPTVFFATLSRNWDSVDRMEALQASALGSLDLVDYAVITVAAFLSSLISGLGGVGGSFILAAVVAPIIGVKAVLPLIAVYSMFTNVSRIGFYFRDINPRKAVIGFLAAAPGVMIGTTIYQALNPTAVAIVLGVVVVVAVPLRRWLKGRNYTVGVKGLAAGSFGFGCMSGTTLGSGMILISLLLATGLMGPALLGTDAVIGKLTGLMRMAMFGAYQLLPWDLLVAGLLTGFVTVPGTWIASRIVRRTDVRIHTIGIEIIIVVGGLSFLLQAFS